MEVYLGRQPILDREMETVAYELLYRSGGETNQFSGVDGSKASGQVLYNLFYGMGPEEVTGGRKAFINFTRSLLLSDAVYLLDPGKVVIEVLEDVRIDEKLVEACKKMVQKGFVLALDDFVLQEGIEDLLEIASVVKLDWMADPYEKLKGLVKTLEPYGVELLAEKIESRDEFHKALDLGCVYFQGYFFQRPVIIQRNDVPVSSWSSLRLLGTVQKPELELNELGEIIASDPPLSYKLLKLVNSAAFRRSKAIESIQQALVILGDKEIKRWITLLLMAEMSQDQPRELIVTAVSRGRMAELLAQESGHGEHGSGAFLCGMLSLLNAMMGRPLAELLSDLPLHSSVKEALLEKKGPLAPYLFLAVAYERGNEKVIEQCARVLKLPHKEIGRLFMEAFQWTSSFLTGVD